MEKAKYNYKEPETTESMNAIAYGFDREGE